MRIIEYLALFFLAHSGVSSTPISFCPGDSDVCLQWAVPEDANESSSKNIYFQIEAPTSYQWIGLGIGNQMAGAVIFVMYEDGEGNVTVSHREGKGHTMPLALEHGGITLLSGSGIKDGNMVANVRYAQPDDIDLSGDSSWIMARKEGASLASTDADQSITVHDEHFAFSVDLSQALVSSDVNPFDTTDSDGATPPPSSGGVKEQDSNPNQQLILAHGIMMTVVFVAVYPLGSLLMPLLGKWYIHAGWQMVGFSAMWAAFGIGYVVSDRLDVFFDQAHTRLGVFVVALLSIQPLLGIFHHVQYRRQKKRGLFGHVHIWYGRFTIILGVVNGGLGLQLTGASNGYVIAYSVVAGVSTLIYAGFSVAKVPVLKKKQRDLAL